MSDRHPFHASQAQLWAAILLSCAAFGMALAALACAVSR